jgi:hypothetical protein
VGFVAGFGEMVGYGLRSVSGYFADKTHRYWAVTFVAGSAIMGLLYDRSIVALGSFQWCCNFSPYQFSP